MKKIIASIIWTALKLLQLLAWSHALSRATDGLLPVPTITTSLESSQIPIQSEVPQWKVRFPLLLQVVVVMAVAAPLKFIHRSASESTNSNQVDIQGLIIKIILWCQLLAVSRNNSVRPSSLWLEMSAKIATYWVKYHGVAVSSLLRTRSHHHQPHKQRSSFSSSSISLLIRKLSSNHQREPKAVAPSLSWWT